MEILHFLLFFSVFSTVYACSSSYCSSFSLDYPFKVDTSNPPNSCTYINLTCSNPDQFGTPIVSVPYGLDFNVRFIGYLETYIELYDPGDCLMGRLMKLNLSPSPFKAIDYQNYTFYTCPISAYLTDLEVLPIHCLGNITSKTISTATIPPDIIFQRGCNIIGSFQLPVLEQNQFEYDGIHSDLYLKWNDMTCSDCEEGHSNLWTKFTGSSYFPPSCVVLASFSVICFLKIVKLIVGVPSEDVQPESDSAATAPPAGGLDDSKINACTELVFISESRINIGPDSITCSICLESYVPQDTVRNIAKCEHCFHAECIELWLRKNRTCPVCRTDVEL